MNTISPDIQQSWFKIESILSLSNDQDDETGLPLETFLLAPTPQTKP
jgi:hypothetical protein